MARSSDSGRTWFIKAVSPGGGFMPALAANASGVDVSYYQRMTNHRLKVAVARSTDGFFYARSNLSSNSFGVPYTFPPFDPFIAPCYMGDYNGATVTGGPCTRLGETTGTRW